MKNKNGLLGKLILAGFFLSASLMNYGTFAGDINEKNKQNSRENKINQEGDKKEVKITPYEKLPAEFRKKIENYQINAIHSKPELTFANSILYSFIKYDINEASVNEPKRGDGIIDVIEFYKVEQYSLDIIGEVKYTLAKKPCTYVFNWHDYKQITSDEMLLDPNENGITGEGSGDERWSQEPIIEQYKEKGL